MSDLTAQFSTIEQKLDTTLTGINEAKTKAQTLETEVKGVQTSVEGIKTQVTEVETNLKGEIKVVRDEVDIIKRDSAKIVQSTKGETQKPFNELLADAITKNEDAIRNYRKEQGEVRFDLLPEVKAKNDKETREVKAVGDMTIAANFATANTFQQDIRGRIETPYNRVWLADVIPGGNSTGTSVLYPKENGGEGAAALWAPGADKPQMDFDITGTSAYFKWIAGIVIVEREMLDDIPFMTAYIQNKMLISLKTAENTFILDGSGADSNPVPGINDVATAYDGTQTAAVDRILDAAYGQIVEDTFEFYSPTHTVLTPRDSVNIGLNKATGSGEYDLPEGSVAFANGRLNIAGLQNVTSMSVGTGNFLTFDARALMFIRRMQPELRMFEDAALAKRNKIMFRIEERVTLAIFNNAAIVKGTLEGV